MPPDFRILLKNDYGELSKLKNSVMEYCSIRDLPSGTVFGILLSLDEIVTNIISYAWDDDREHLISIGFKSAPGAVEFEIEDDGKPFDPMQYAPPDVMSPLEERAVGGLGIHLVQTYMDEISYKREGGKNCLLMRKII